MKRSIFYSWQSDLPNNQNRGFIESCISASVKELSKLQDFHIELNLDRDTKNELGTPDIVNTIFKKIDKSQLFIADISIINSNSDGRKTPNPNVLLELGYAAKVLGWEKIICIFNSDYGDFNDLPFDLRFRRPLSYSLKGKERLEIKDMITKVITQTIKELHSRGLLDDEFNEYFKMQVDTQILSVMNNITKILFGYDEINRFKSYNDLLNLKQEDYLTLISDRKFLGFQVYKRFEPIAKELNKLLETLTASYFNKELGVVIVNFIKWISRFDKFNSLRQSSDLFISSGEVARGYRTVYAPDINPNNKDGYLLLKELNENNGQVIDFGEFHEKQKIDSMLKYVYLNENYKLNYAELLFDCVGLITKWLEYTNGELIFDNLNNFEIREVVTPPQKLKEILSKTTVSLEDDLMMLANDKFNFDYASIIQINSLVHFIRQGFILDNHLKAIDNLNRQINGKIQLRGDLSIIPILEDEFKISQLSEDERLEGIEKLKKLRRGSFDVDYIYVTHKYKQMHERLDRLYNNASLSDGAKKHILQIINDSQVNLLTHMIEPLKRFVIESAIAEIDSSLNFLNVYDEFNKQRIYHERDINLLFSEVRHLLQK
ncbi:hypothetical protein [Paenibacillus sp. FJAT-26967]|uniref:hypothetical protein n=1 Tax=Paenibacillus sp. FJAT-26967 TaxID=1729690 RepID=UPI00083800E4|nr:hypothetical protein [Paenibacillus sp. FJAT-26967]